MRFLFPGLLTIPVICLCASGALNAQTVNSTIRNPPQPGANATTPGGPGNVLPTNGPSASPDSPGVAVDTHSYVIGSEDALGISIWREPELSRVVLVRPDGKISLPMIGEIQASGTTPDQLGKNLAAAYSKFINNPEVLVSVQAVNSKKYYIDGAVNRPGEYRLITPTTVLEALSESGGFREFANLKKIRILRGTTTLKFNYKDVSHGKHMDQNIYLQNGDHIFVDE